MWTDVHRWLEYTVLPLIICTVTTPAVAAEDIKKPITQWTCSEFLSIDEDVAQVGAGSGGRSPGPRP